MLKCISKRRGDGHCFTACDAAHIMSTMSRFEMIEHMKVPREVRAAFVSDLARLRGDDSWLAWYDKHPLSQEDMRQAVAQWKEKYPMPEDDQNSIVRPEEIENEREQARCATTEARCIQSIHSRRDMFRPQHCDAVSEVS